MNSRTWPNLLGDAVRAFIREEGITIDPSHVAETPYRVVKAWKEYISGYEEEPTSVLVKAFSKGKYDEMVHVDNIRIISRCAHHFEPIVGVAHFAYVPKKAIVGLSKIPRFIRILSHRLQVQEDLTQQIVDTFQKYVQPAGCAVSIKAYHFCMLTRGVREHASTTTTTAFRGVFKTKPETRREFLSAISHKKVFL